MSHDFRFRSQSDEDGLFGVLFFLSMFGFKILLANYKKIAFTHLINS